MKGFGLSREVDVLETKWRRELSGKPVNPNLLKNSDYKYYDGYYCYYFATARRDSFPNTDLVDAI